MDKTCWHYQIIWYYRHINNGDTTMTKQKIILVQIEKQLANILDVRKIAKNNANCNDTYNALTNVYKIAVAMKTDNTELLLSVATQQLLVANDIAANWKNETLRTQVLAELANIENVVNNLAIIA